MKISNDTSNLHNCFLSYDSETKKKYHLKFQIPLETVLSTISIISFDLL